MPGTYITNHDTAGRHGADGAESHPLWLILKAGDLHTGMLGARNLPGWTVKLGHVLGQEIHTHIGTGQIPDAHMAKGIMKGAEGAAFIINPVMNIRMQGLVVYGSRQTEVAACSPERIVRGTKYGIQKLGHRRYIQQHLPGRMMELATGQAGTAKRISVGAAVTFMVLVKVNDLFGYPITACRQYRHLLRIEDITDGHKTIPV